MLLLFFYLDAKEPKDQDAQYFEINKQAKLHFDKVIESIESCIDSLGIS